MDSWSKWFHKYVPPPWIQGGQVVCHDPDMWLALRYCLEEQYYENKQSHATIKFNCNMEASFGKPRLTVFSGGNVYFPYEKRESLLQKIAQDASNGCRMYWNQIAYEREGEGMRMVFDIDSDRELSALEIQQITETCWQTLKTYYTNFATQPIPIFTAQCGPRMKKKMISVALHIVCHVNVTLEQAMQITSGFEMRLKQRDNLNLSGLEVDAGIYKVNSRSVSLRMIFSHKLEDCVVCNNADHRRMDCTGPCGQSGRVVSNFTYSPSMCIIDGQGPHASTQVFKEYHATMFDIMCNYSIWPEEGECRSDYKIPDSDPVYVVCVSKKRKEGDIPSVIHPKAQAFSPSWLYLQDEIRTLEKSLAFVEVSSVQINARGSAFVNLSGLGSGQCPWTNTNHGPTRLYFQLWKNGRLVLRCKSNKGANPCNKREPKEYSVSATTANRVFGIATPSFGLTT